MKTQNVRLLDVFALGPFMIWASRQLRPSLARDAMLVSGILTILYNGVNYIKVERGEDAIP